MKNFIKVFGAIISSAVVLPLTYGYSGGLVLANSFQGIFGGGEKKDVFTPELQLALLTIVLVFSTPMFTIMNYVKPDNELRVPSSITVILAGLITSLAIAYNFRKSFSLQVGLVMLCCLLIFVSGILQLVDKGNE